MLGSFQLSGILKGLEPEKGLLRVEASLLGVGGNHYTREVLFHLRPDDVYLIREAWLPEGTVLVHGELHGERDTLALRANRIHLMRSPIRPSLNRASLWGVVRERLSESVYLMGASPESEELFPVESHLPLIQGRSYLMEGSLSPRFYERTGLLQIRFRAQEVREYLALLEPWGTLPKRGEGGGEAIRSFLEGP